MLLIKELYQFDVERSNNEYLDECSVFDFFE